MAEDTPRHESGLSFLFDLDGTLVDSVYQHVLSWHEALQSAGIPLSIWRIHRRIGMSGGLFANALLREMGRPISPELIRQLRQAHADAFRIHGKSVVPLPGARELLACLTEQRVPWAISRRPSASAPTFSIQWWLATAYGTFSPPGAPVRWA